LSGVASRKIFKYRGSVSVVSSSAWDLFEKRRAVRRITSILRVKPRLSTAWIRFLQPFLILVPETALSVAGVTVRTGAGMGGADRIAGLVASRVSAAPMGTPQKRVAEATRRKANRARWTRDAAGKRIGRDATGRARSRQPFSETGGLLARKPVYRACKHFCRLRVSSGERGGHFGGRARPNLHC
jgi:hypothetical protein